MGTDNTDKSSGSKAFGGHFYRFLFESER